MNTPQKVALLGFDCAIIPLVRKHIAEGICPNFKQVIENGVVAENCLAPLPTITPPNWTVMSTGAWQGTNGITDFNRQIPGLDPTYKNSHSMFNYTHVASESFWEAAERAGKRNIIFNYPSSFNAHKRLKNSVVVGGSGLTPGVFMDTHLASEIKGIPYAHDRLNYFTFCDDVLVSTDIYPGTSVRVKFAPASGWSNVPDMGDDPLDATFEMPFANSIYDTKPATWHILVRDLGGKGYDTLTLSPGKDFNNAFFSVKSGQWSPAFDSTGLLADGGSKTLRQKALLVSMDDEAENLKLYITSGLNKDGEYWCYPPSEAARLNTGDNVATNNVGMWNLSLGWFDLDDWMRIIEVHYDWLGDAAEALLGDGKWDTFFTHAHPTDYIYHALMTELDPATCTSPAAHAKAWECHAKLYQYADRYLGRLLKLMDDNTLITLISDHGATPDGPAVNMNDVLEKAGLAVFNAGEAPKYLESLPENLRETSAFNYTKVIDVKKSRTIPSRTCFVYVNLKGRDPNGIVEPEDYEKTQREIVDALMTYVHPKTGKRPFALALPKKEAMILGHWGDATGDVVYALWPEYSFQHGAILPTSEYGIGTLKPLCVFYGPKCGVRKGVSMDRVCWLTDLVPTYCYMTGWPIPKTAEGAVIYQIMEDPDFRPACK